MHTNHVILFARAPVYGAVKQRLARDIGKQAALDFYRDTLSSLMQRLQHGPWQLHVSVAASGDEKDPLFQSIPTTPQPEGDLGFRMYSVLERFNGSNRIIIGSDIPAIESSHLQNAFDALRCHDMVFGPATDGGFWLVGCANSLNLNSSTRSVNTHTAFMKNVRWSSSNALTDTLATVPAGLQVGKVATLSDVDDGEAYQKFVHSTSFNGK